MSFEFLQADNFIRYSIWIAASLIILFVVFKVIVFVLNKRGIILINSKFLKVLINSIMVISAVLFVYSSYNLVASASKAIYPLDPSLGTITVNDTNPILVKFNRPVDKKTLQYEINPKAEGDWQISTGLFSKEQTLKFIPSESLEFAKRYTISVTGIKNLFSSKKEDFLFSFELSSPPVIKNINLAEGDDGVLPGQKFEVEVDYLDKNAKFAFDLSGLELNIEVLDNKYIISSKEPLKRGTNYTFKIFRSLYKTNYKNGEQTLLLENEDIKSINFKTIEAPGVKLTSPTGQGVLIDKDIEVEFTSNMDKKSVEANFSISPNISGKFTWENERKFKFIPSDSLQRNTKYTVSISKKITSADGSEFENDINFNFTTIGYVTVSKFLPSNGATKVDLNTDVRISFNQAVDHASAESKFSISPEVSGAYSWDGNTLIFKHNNFEYSKKYTVSIPSGVKSINGLDSKDSFTSSFNTKEQSISLSITAYRQSYKYSCMSSAAKSALSYKGVSVSEDTLINLMGRDSTPWSGTWREADAVWGDPSVGIVGDLSGNSAPGWGYGAHWSPVAKAINNYKTAEIKTGWNVSGIAEELKNGNPVIVWWVNGVWPAYEVFWKTSGGKSIRAVNSMHVQVVKGFTGSIENPTSFTVTDSGFNYPAQTFDAGTFKAKWNWFGNTAIVVK